MLQIVLILLCSFFWVIPRRLNFIRRRFGTLFHLHRSCVLMFLKVTETVKYLSSYIDFPKLSRGCPKPRPVRQACCARHWRIQPSATESLLTYGCAMRNARQQAFVTSWRHISVSVSVFMLIVWRPNYRYVAGSYGTGVSYVRQATAVMQIVDSPTLGRVSGHAEELWMFDLCSDVTVLCSDVTVFCSDVTVLCSDATFVFRCHFCDQMSQFCV
jgi:hypothetical protein